MCEALDPASAGAFNPALFGIDAMRLTAGLIVAGSLFPSAALAAGAATPQIGWETLRPADQAVWIPGLPASATAPQQGETLSWDLKDKTVKLSGYLLPVDLEGDEVYEFLLVPEPGGCSHMAQPPANQVVHVTMREPYKLTETYEPVSVTGIVRPGLETTQLEIVDGTKVVESGYRFSGAQVTAADLGPRKPMPGVDNPWAFLKK